MLELHPLQRRVARPPLALITEGALPNAFLFFNGRRPHVAANIGMLNLLGDDEAAWAALFGHELAHFTQRHRDTRAERESVSDTAGGLLGAASPCLFSARTPAAASASSPCARWRVNSPTPRRMPACGCPKLRPRSTERSQEACRAGKGCHVQTRADHVPVQRYPWVRYLAPCALKCLTVNNQVAQAVIEPMGGNAGYG